MARRPAGLQTTARHSATPGASVTPAPAGSQSPAGSGSPERGTRSAAVRRPRLVALRLAAAAQGLEAAGLVVAAGFAAVSTADGRSYQLASGIVLTLVALGTAAGLAGIAVGLARAWPWTRIPTAMTQLFVIIGGITLLQGHRPDWGVPALVLAGACVAGLMTPASLRALNRPPVQPQAKAQAQAQPQAQDE